MLPVISSGAKGRTDKGEAQRLGDHHNKAEGLLCIRTAARLRCLVFAETADDLPLLSLPLAQPRQDRLNCLISKRASEELASSTLFNVKSATERKG